jgi:hypothetical protein
MIFQGLPLFDFEPHYDNVEHGQLDDVTLKAAGIGPATPWKPTTSLKRTLRLSFQFETQDEWRALRDFMAARGGIIESFWLPIWITDYPMTALAGQSATIRPIGLANYFSIGNQFAYAALIRPQRGGPVIEPHRINSIAVGVSEVLNFNEPVGDGWNAQTSMLCGLIVARFANSQVDWPFESDAVGTVDLDFTECPKEYPALI